jgi:hypothetical protein
MTVTFPVQFWSDIDTLICSMVSLEKILRIVKGGYVKRGFKLAEVQG